MPNTSETKNTLETNTSLKIIPIAAESFGVRSFSFFISTPDINILLDPGCALGPKRFGLPPHKTEFAQLHKKTLEILEYSKKSNLIFISHYHHDHFKPRLPKDDLIYTNYDLFEKIYGGKLIIGKRTDDKINRNQKIRGIKFHKDIENLRWNMKNERNGDNGENETKFFRIGQDPINDSQFYNFENSENISGCKLRKLTISDESLLQSVLHDAFYCKNTYLFFPHEFLHGIRKDNKKIYIQPVIIAYSARIFYFFPDVQGFSCEEDLERLFLLKDEISNFLNEKAGRMATDGRFFTHIIAFGGIFARINQTPPKGELMEFGESIKSMDSNKSMFLKKLVEHLKPSLEIIRKFDRIYTDHHITRIPHFHWIFDYFNSYITNNSPNTKISTLNSQLDMKVVENLYNLIENNPQAHKSEISELIRKNDLYLEVFRRELRYFL